MAKRVAEAMEEGEEPARVAARRAAMLVVAEGVVVMGMMAERWEGWVRLAESAAERVGWAVMVASLVVEEEMEAQAESREGRAAKQDRRAVVGV